MILSFAQLLLWLQPAATGPGGGGGAAPAGGDTYCLMQGGMMLAVLLFTYIFMIRPDQKRREEVDAMLKSLRKGMKVRTKGGILGEIVSVTEHEVILAVADKVRINVLRSAIEGPEPESRESGDSKASKDDKDDKGAKKPDEARG